MTTSYQSPLGVRYASEEMNSLFSSQKRHSTWRKMWLALAQAEKDLGLPITQEQINELSANIDNIDFKKADEYELELKHDVMAHVHAYGDLCPKARPIIHLGATSCLITDNSDVLILREGLLSIRSKLVTVITKLSETAEKYMNLPCLAFTHFQTAQPTTLGKRISLWLQDFLLDLEDLEFRLQNLRLLGIKGATGTQASFLNLFDGDHEKVKKLESLFCQRLGFGKPFPLTGQTYTRKQDVQIIQVLSGIATSAHKMATDLRLLAHLKEVEEPFSNKQIGSSAMPYKRNPMQSERICSIARFVMSLSENPTYTAATQWFERTLDDSANRRLCIPESFLAVDSILRLLINISGNMVVYPKVIEKHLKEELPFLATENILMESVKKGADRQNIHERIRQHSISVSRRMKEEGLENDLIARITNDKEIPLSKEDLENCLEIQRYVGRAPEQLKEFLENDLSKILDCYKEVDIEKESQVLICN
jgi:adenylosuccinate lyase